MLTTIEVYFGKCVNPGENYYSLFSKIKYVKIEG